MERPTFADIARQAGVSTATVSRAMARQEGVSTEVAERVREVARSLGYQAARYLRCQRSDAIGLVVADVQNPFFAAIAH